MLTNDIVSFEQPGPVNINSFCWAGLMTQGIIVALKLLFEQYIHSKLLEFVQLVKS